MNADTNPSCSRQSMQQPPHGDREVYRILAEFSPELALLSNPDGSIRYISPNCLQLTGYADREFLAAPGLLESIVHRDDLAAWRERSGAIGPGASAAPIDLRLIGRDGETRWFNYCCQRVSGPDGSYQGLRGSLRSLPPGLQREDLPDRQHGFAESLLESTSTPLFAIGTDHRVIIWNRAMAELTGVPAREMLGTDHQWQPFYPKPRPTLCDLVLDDRTEQIGAYYEEFDRDVVMPGIVRAGGGFPSLGGRERRLLFDAAPVRRNGKVIAVVETLYDITSRSHAEEQLRLLSRAVEQTASTIVITDPGGSIQYANNTFCRATGYQLAEVIGQNPRILKSGMQKPQVYAELWDTISSGREWHGEMHNRRKDGSFFWESAIISPITEANGAISHYLAVKEDITSRKETERQLQKKQAELVLKHEQLANLFRQVEQGKREWEQTMDCVDAMVAMVDDEGRIRRCNRAFMRLTGSDYQQLESQDWHGLLRDAGLDIDSLEGFSGELFHALSRRWLALKTYPYDEGRGEVIMLHDLTEIRQVSEQLAAAYQDLKATHSQLLQQEKMASIGQLAAGVAHEINNPMGFISSNLGTMEKYLNRISGFLELQTAGIEESAPQKLREELAQARRSIKVDYILEDARALLAESRDGAERVRTIVQNLKSFSRVDDTQTSYIELNECLETTITIAWNELKYKATLQRDYGELPPVKCRPQQLNQVFLNILVNAAHAIETQGQITVTTRSARGLVTVAIHDTGCGIPEEIRNRIFEPFFTTKEVGKGTGLGLSISYDIIKKHGGTLEVESPQGCGATFTITLPVEGVQG
jgi:two-component system, NtrC family, sensor kinase